MWSFLKNLFRKNSGNHITEKKSRTELLAMDKKELELHGRKFGIELDRRRSKEALVKQVLEAQISNG
jgi:hypothetical protein